MPVSEIAFELLAAHSQAAAVIGLGLYIAYEIRIGAMQQIREDQRTIGIGLYRVMEHVDEINEENFRQSLWGESDTGLLYSDLADEEHTPRDPPKGEA